VVVSSVQLPITVAVTTHAFDVGTLVLGAALVFGALASAIAHRSFLSLAALFVVVGFVLGPGVLGVVHFNARAEFVGDLATIALVVILFRDGLEVDAETLQEHWHLPLRKLVLAMPLTALVVALAARWLTGGSLSWSECFLLGALLAPTDPVLISGVITNPRVPSTVRHSLNLESGLNDGLALPAVLAFSAALGGVPGHFVWWKFVLQDLSVGLATGVVMGLLASVVLPRGDGLGGEIPPHQKALYALGAAFATYGFAVLPPHGNGLIAVFVSAITLGIRRPDIRDCFEHHAEGLVEIVKLGIFVVFGSLLTLGGLFGDGWAAIGIVAATLLVARPVGVFVALVGTKLDFATRGFMAWFGPKGVGTMAFSLLVLSERIASGERIFNLAALVVFCSIIAHGSTDTAGANWLVRREERQVRVTGN
jgi:sodium/hydrogen antiporter